MCTEQYPATYLNLANASAATHSTLDVPALDRGHQVRLVPGQIIKCCRALEAGPSSARNKRVSDAAATELGAAGGDGTRVRHIENLGAALARIGGNRGLGALEAVAFEEHTGARGDVEVMALIVGEVVVDSLHGCAGTADFRGKAGDVVVPVSVEGELIAVGDEHRGPILVAVA